MRILVRTDTNHCVHLVGPKNGYGYKCNHVTAEDTERQFKYYNKLIHNTLRIYG